MRSILWTQITALALQQLERKSMSIKNSQHIQNMCQGTHFIPDMSLGSQSVFWTRWHLFLMGYHVPPDWNYLVPLAQASSPHNENWNMSRTQEGHWGLWIFQSDKVLINSREKGDPIICYALSLYWLRDKVVRNEISEQLYVLLNEKLSWIKLPSLYSLAQLIFFIIFYVYHTSSSVSFS